MSRLYQKQSGAWTALDTPGTDLTALTAKVGSGVYQVINVKDPPYNAVGDGVNDDGAEIQAAIDALNADGGTIFFPVGVYNFATPLNLEGLRAVRLIGSSGLSAGAGSGTMLRYTGTTTAGINLKSSFGIELSDMMLLHTGNLTAKTFIDASHGAAATDSAYLTINRCFIGGAGTSTASGLVALDKAIIVAFHDCVFGGAALQVKGKGLEASYSNVISFYNCTFTAGAVTMPVRDPGVTWSFHNCTFEALSSGDAGAIDISATFTTTGLSLFGCHFNDANDQGAWVEFSGRGFTSVGCQYGAGMVGVRLGGNDEAHGVTMVGNYFDLYTNGVAAVAGSHTNWLIVGNSSSALLSGPMVAYAAGSIPANSFVQADDDNVFPFGVLPMIPGAVNDGSFPDTPPNGTYAYDSTNFKLYIRSGGAWKSSAAFA